MVTLADLRARNIQPSWQEAVAVVQELVQTVSSTGAGLPDLEHVALIPNGDVVVLPGSFPPEEPVRHAALMLQGLVDGAPTPPELAQFIERNVSVPAQSATLADFARNLSFYERPGRRADVERLVARVVAIAQNTRAEEELRRLKERTLENDDRRLEQTVFSDTVAMTGRKRPTFMALAGIAAVVLLVVGGWWWWQRARAPQAPDAAPPAVAQNATAVPPSAATNEALGGQNATAPTATGAPGAPGATGPSAVAPEGAKAEGAKVDAPAVSPAPQPSLLDQAAATVKSAVDKVMGTQEAPKPVAAAPPTPPPAPPKKKPTHKKAPQPVVQEVVPAVAMATPPPAPPTARPAPPAPIVLAAPPVDDAVYTMTDAAVIPPVLVRPVIPKDPPRGVPEDQIGSIEVLVDEQGDVEAVRLASPANRYQERMLVSAAKMWKFRPAFKDGHPVRYRTRVRLTV